MLGRDLALKIQYPGVARSITRELGSRNITANVVAPGFIETEMTAVLPEARKAEIIKAVPAGRLATAGLGTALAVVYAKAAAGEPEQAQPGFGNLVLTAVSLAVVVAAAAADHLWMHFARQGRHPEVPVPVVTRGEGAYIWDDAGTRYLDATAGLWFTNVGHGRTEIATAVADQIGKLAHYSNFGDLTSEPTVELAERLAAIAEAAEE